jgi:hypothetical protein
MVNRSSYFEQPATIFNGCFNLITEDLSSIEIKETFAKDKCLIKDKAKDNFYYSSFILTENTRSKTLCSVSFYPSSITSKYIPRLAFKRVDKDGVDRTIETRKDINISFSDSESAQIFWKLIRFLGSFKEIVDLGEFAHSFQVIDGSISPETLSLIKEVFANPEKQEVLDFIVAHEIIPNDLFIAFQQLNKVKAIETFEVMLAQDLKESDWQKWFTNNSWVLGTEFVKILEERNIDTQNISDFLMEAYDGFLDIVEIKRPDGGLKFWAEVQDHNNWIPHSDLIKALTQASKYIYEVEREANSQKFLERVGYVKTIKPRCILIYGRSLNWDKEKKESFRILNSNYHNLTIMTYDHILERAKRLLD